MTAAIPEKIAAATYLILLLETTNKISFTMPFYGNAVDIIQR
jgi:hypothetical protein